MPCASVFLTLTFVYRFYLVKLPVKIVWYFTLLSSIITILYKQYMCSFPVVILRTAGRSRKDWILKRLRRTYCVDVYACLFYNFVGVSFMSFDDVNTRSAYLVKKIPTLLTLGNCAFSPEFVF